MKSWPIQRPVQIDSPDRFTSCDMVEVRVILTPLSWVEAHDPKQEERRLRKSGEAVYSQYSFARIEAQDHRALFHIARQLLWNLFAEYLGIER